MSPLPTLLAADAVCPGAALPTDEAEPLAICVGCSRLAAFAAAQEAGRAVRLVFSAAIVVDGLERCANRLPAEG